MISSGNQLGLIQALVDVRIIHSKTYDLRVVVETLGNVVQDFAIYELKPSWCIWRFNAGLHTLNVKLEEPCSVPACSC